MRYVFKLLYLSHSYFYINLKLLQLNLKLGTIQFQIESAEAHTLKTKKVPVQILAVFGEMWLTDRVDLRSGVRYVLLLQGLP